MAFNGHSDTAGGIFESADVPGPVLSQRIEHGEVLKIIGSSRFQELRKAAKAREQALYVARVHGRPAAAS